MSGPEAKPSSNWDDLKVRVISAIAMLAVGLGAVIAGGIWFQILVVFAAGVMIWELWSMIAPDRPKPAMLLGIAISTILMALLGASAPNGLLTTAILFLGVPSVGFLIAGQHQALFALFSLATAIACYTVVVFRLEFGFLWILWVMLVVIASDTFGYLAGRTFGGPKFWPKISPKKTWSGTIAGWIGAAAVGLIFAMTTEATFVLIPISMLVALAGQMGDIAESALKRKVGIKDSSDLIPGHGGLLDRFDAMLGSTLFLAVIVYLLQVPGVTF
jgi:phosphatidate cytidylyltransferase